MQGNRQPESAGAGRRADNGREWYTLGQAAAFLGAAQSTVRKWADGGRLRAFYTPGGHRRFRRADLEAFLAVPRGAQAPAKPAGASVLVVDDDASLRAFVRANLEREGYAVREAGSASEGLAALDEEPPDLILLDVMMPSMDGWEMLRRVHERHGVDAIQVIMYSGKLDEAGTAEERGAQAFIGKPFDPRKLLDATRQLLGS
jgi:excisionase family DNA binding protein